MALAAAELDLSNSSMPLDDAPIYCGAGVAAFSELYSHIHGYLALGTCVFGLSTNLVSIAVLTRKTMATPTNAILAAIAIADIMVMLMFLPFVLHHHIQAFGDSSQTYAWAAFTLAFVQVTQVFHTVSIWLTVMLAVWRYLAIGHPALNRKWCTRKNTILSIVLVYIACSVISAPNYLTYAITGCSDMQRDAENCYVVDYSALSQRYDHFLEKLNLWVFSVHVKLLPCVILTIFSFCLIFVLYKTNQSKVKLLLRSNAGAKKVSLTKRSAIHTTRMLLAMLLMLLVTEAPHGMLSLLSGILGKTFHDQCYTKLGDLMDILALFNSSMNFIFYCSMSTQFRTTFEKLFPSFRWAPTPFSRNEAVEGTNGTPV